jgi:iron complex outermembrane receptor protein
MSRTARIHALLLLGLAVPACVLAQAPPTTPATQPPTTPANQPATPRIQPVTTTVVVHGAINGDYLPDTVTVGTLDGAPLLDAPLSAAVVTRDLLNDQVSRLLSDVVKNDASVTDDYVPVGYYGDYQIRGFPLDLATGFEVNGISIAGEQDVPLENKQSVEFLKGIAGIESGVANAGGLIDYVTKRPAAIEAIDLATDHRGTAYGAVDLGHLFGSQKQIGARVNLAAERIVTYMNDTNGWRAVGAAAADWKLSPKAILKGDFEYQHKTERDGSGYQLLGGATLPDINRIYRSTLLGDQPWGPPDTYDTFNTGARFNYTFSPTWVAFAAASFSHSLIQDNVIYAYGCYYESLCTPNGGTSPPYFFAPDGTYDIYDYRDPGELRIDAVAEAMITGHIRTGAITQDITGGGELFLRSVQQPGFYTVQNPYDPSGIVQDGAVYTYVGSEDIYQALAPIPQESPLESAGPRRLWEDSHQSALVLQDRIHLPGHIQLIAGGRYNPLHDHNYSAYASCANALDLNPATASNPNPCAPAPTNKSLWLPQYAVTYNPVSNLTLYSNYGVLLSLGPQGPFWTDNGSQFLAPFFTRQAEVGAKYRAQWPHFAHHRLLPHDRAILLSQDSRRARCILPCRQPRRSVFRAAGPRDPQRRRAQRRRQSSQLAQPQRLGSGNERRLHRLPARPPTTTSWSSMCRISHSNLFADVAVPHIRGLPSDARLELYRAERKPRATTRSACRATTSSTLARATLQAATRAASRFTSTPITLPDKRYWSDTGCELRRHIRLARRTAPPSGSLPTTRSKTLPD